MKKLNMIDICFHEKELGFAGNFFYSRTLNKWRVKAKNPYKMRMMMVVRLYFS